MASTDLGVTFTHKSSHEPHENKGTGSLSPLDWTENDALKPAQAESGEKGELGATESKEGRLASTDPWQAGTRAARGFNGRRP